MLDTSQQIRHAWWEPLLVPHSEFCLAFKAHCKQQTMPTTSDPPPHDVVVLIHRRVGANGRGITSRSDANDHRLTYAPLLLRIRPFHFPIIGCGLAIEVVRL